MPTAQPSFSDDPLFRNATGLIQQSKAGRVN